MSEGQFVPGWYRSKRNGRLISAVHLHPDNPERVYYTYKHLGQNKSTYMTLHALLTCYEKCEKE